MLEPQARLARRVGGKHDGSSASPPDLLGMKERNVQLVIHVRPIFEQLEVVFKAKTFVANVIKILII